MTRLFSILIRRGWSCSWSACGTRSSPEPPGGIFLVGDIVLPHRESTKYLVKGIKNDTAGEIGQSALDSAPVEQQASKAQQKEEEVPAAGRVFDLILGSISKFTGSDPSEFGDDTLIADLGVDSIMAIEIVTTVNANAGVELRASFVADYLTTGDLRREFGGAPTS